MTTPDVASVDAQPVSLPTLWVRLNFAATPEPGWLNIHSAAKTKVELTADLTDADVPADGILKGDLTTFDVPDHWAVQRIYIGHVLEQIPLDEVVPALIRLRAITRPKTPVICMATDWEKAEERGQQIPASSLWECREKTLARLFVEAGYTGVVYLRPDSIPLFWPVVDRVSDWQCAVAATS